MTWEAYLAALRRDRGGWVGLADELIRCAAAGDAVPTEPPTVEKGLRRLAARGHREGGQYGRWVLRYFGPPPDFARWATMMGQYHSRFADFPTSLRHQQLSLWNRPPVSESPLSVWIDLGLASLFHRLRRRSECREHLALAAKRGRSCSPAALAELNLFLARVATDDGDLSRAQSLLDTVGESLQGAEKTPEHAAYYARWIGQRAYHLTRPKHATREDLQRAETMFASIPDEAIPFVAFRRANGLAYCAWKLGDPERGAALAREAAEHAADGGLVRFRVMALNLLSRILDGAEATRARQRAARLAALLEDEDLAFRVALRWRD